jgi:hypothetical protein
MRPTKFKIESLGYETFDGFTLDEDWNGWACPYFTFDQAQKVLKQFNQLGEIIGSKDLAFYDPESDSDSFVFPADGENEPELVEAIVVNGQKFYPIGTLLDLGR